MMVHREAPIGFRPTKEDRRIVAWLVAKLGIGVSQVIRLALRRLYEAEGKR